MTTIRDLALGILKADEGRTAKSREWTAVYSGYGDNAEPISIAHIGKDKKLHDVIRFEHAQECDAEFVVKSANHAADVCKALIVAMDALEDIRDGLGGYSGSERADVAAQALSQINGAGEGK